MKEIKELLIVQMVSVILCYYWFLWQYDMFEFPKKEALFLSVFYPLVSVGILNFNWSAMFKQPLRSAMS